MTNQERNWIMRQKLSVIMIIILTVVMFMGELWDTAEAADTVQITKNGQVVDTLNGVPATYIMGANNSDTGTYSCARYVSNYYRTLYGVTISNMFTGATPNVDSGCEVRQVSAPQIGDIVYHTNSSGGGHWMIAKAVNGNSVTVIEQNYKWVTNGKTYTYVNRVVTIGSTANLKFFRVYRNGIALNGGPGYTIDDRYPTPFYAYNLANENTPAYDSVNGTYVGSVFGSDRCTIQEVYTNGWCKLWCEWVGYSDGRIVYCPLSTFIASGYTPSTIKAPKRTDVYKRSNGADYMGYIDPDDTVVKVGTSGSYTQTIFPLNTGGYMCAWTPTSNLEVQKYTISYNANGGIGAPGNQTKTQDQTLTLTTSKPNKNYTIT